MDRHMILCGMSARYTSPRKYIVYGKTALRKRYTGNSMCMAHPDTPFQNTLMHYYCT